MPGRRRSPAFRGGGADSHYLRALIECNPLGIVVLRADGSIVDCNRAFEQMFGYERDEVLLRRLDELIVPPGDRDEAKELTARAREGAEVTAEVRRLRKDGTTIEVALHGVEVRVKGVHSGVFAIYEDISDRKRAQEALRAATAAAEAATAAKSAFLANMSHEIRTPMNAIMGMTDLALGTELDDEQREYLQTVREASESLLALIDDILDFSKIEAGKLQLEPVGFRLRDCVTRAVKTLALRAQQKELELAVDVAPEVPDALVGDSVRLRQILINLVGNAIKFTAAGEVVVGARLETLRDDAATLHFFVRDTGIGIAEDKLEDIFESFSQADVSTTREYGGTGLGLAISSQLAERMGGRMWAESRPGEGATFHFILRFDVQGQPVDVTRARFEAELTGERVLVVDDNATNRRILSTTLENWGMEPAEADGAERAVELMAAACEKGSPFAVVLLDCHMPRVDGFQLAERLLADDRFGGTGLMMLTSAGAQGEAARCLELGISSYLTKPVQQADLWDALCTMLSDSEVARPPLVTQHTLREARRSVRVLLAEDNPVNVKLATSLLEKRGHEVSVAANGEEVLALLDADGAFDVVLMDVQMPVMDGLEATAAIRESEGGGRDHLRIIGVTAHAMSGDRQRCLDAGMDDYLPKPFIAKDLFAMIEQ